MSAPTHGIVQHFVTWWLAWAKQLVVAVSRGDWYFTLLIAMAGVIPRLFAALYWAREPVWDGHYYHFGAMRIAAGLGYSEDVMLGGALTWRPWCHYPVGYSGFLAGAYRLFGSGQAVGPLLNVAVGAATIVAVHRLALLFLSPARSRWAALLTALHPGLIAYSAVLMTEPLAGLSLLLMGLSAFALSHSGRDVLTGILMGLGALVRPPSLLALPVLFLARGKPFKKTLIATTIVGATALMTIAPWTLRNCRVMDGCALISTNGGWNLAIGALTPTGRFHTLRAEDGCRVVTGQVQQDRCWAQVGFSVIARDPLAWLAKIPAKLENTFNHESFPIAYLGEANPQEWTADRQEQGRVLLSSFHHLLLVVAVCALFCRPRVLKEPKAMLRQLLPIAALLGFVAYCVLAEKPQLYWLALLLPLLSVVPLPGAMQQSPVERYLFGSIGVTVLTSIVFFGEDRYHIVVSPILCILAAAALRTPCDSPSGA